MFLNICCCHIPFVYVLVKFVLYLWKRSLEVTSVNYGRYRVLHKFTKSSDGCVLRFSREMHETFQVYFRDRFARLSDLLVQEFRCSLADFTVFQKRKQLAARAAYRSPWCIEAGRPQQVARTGWFAQRSLLEDIIYICTYSDGCVQPLGCPVSHIW